MLLTIVLIVAILVFINFLLLFFSCNKVSNCKNDDLKRLKMMKETTTKQSQATYYAATGS